MYFKTATATPILNTPYFKEVFGAVLPFDKDHLVREIEMIALPGMVFEVLEEMGSHILKVQTRQYPSNHNLYLDHRFGRVLKKTSPPTKAFLPSVDIILERMKAKEGLPYVWGGNYSAGLTSWETYYPIPQNFPERDKAHWTFKGLDCSGLLYEACGGMVPRNTSELLHFGKEASLREIKPLDLIVYPGHVIIALSEEEVIESALEFGGVKRSPLEERVSQIEKPFTVRRFYTEIT